MLQCFLYLNLVPCLLRSRGSRRSIRVYTCGSVCIYVEREEERKFESVTYIKKQVSIIIIIIIIIIITRVRIT
jgi:hypothetical protein